MKQKTEVFREVHKGKKLNEDMKKNSGEGASRAVPSQNSEGSSRVVSSQSSEGSKAIPSQNSEGTSREVPSQNSEARAMPSQSSEGSKAIPSQNSEGTSRPIPSQNSEARQSVNMKEQESSPDTVVSKNSEDVHMRKKEEIRDEFEIASSYGKEVALMLEVGKLPYQPRFTVLKILFTRFLYLIAPSLSSSHPPSRRSVRLAFSTMKMAKSYYEDSEKDINMKSSNLSSSLEKLYVWEKKLYKEVKDGISICCHVITFPVTGMCIYGYNLNMTRINEKAANHFWDSQIRCALRFSIPVSSWNEERLRVIYEKEYKRLKALDDKGAESSKIDASQASIRKLLIKLNVCIKAVDAISSRIHKLRDEELQPQVTELIHGLTRMWKSMLKCHQKQFQAIMESKTQSLKANTGFQGDSSLRATLELEMELRTWCSRFNDWINSQKSFVESFNGWLLRCLLYEPEETPDGIVPFSPGRIGAPPVFVVCNDWSQAVETISERGLTNAMHNFASVLRQLWERQSEEQHQRLKAEYVSKDFQRQLRTLRMERRRMEGDQDSMSNKTGVSIVPSESEVSPPDDLKVDLDSMRKRLNEERAKHKEAVKLMHHAATNSLQAGLIPIFEALENFTSKALQAYEQVRIQNAAQSSEGGK
ncbi:hypothetical protein F0562_028008 [Nyssa sinensis]|uniref:DUF632 domain-containing protein n=1 Tax=Nyssa sinensis TaxID=561372 RepID=A0A5J5B7Z4_9ASTE|nr:hypothetical protein F0562_028008 [Nyssa sinensis]